MKKMNLFKVIQLVVFVVLTILCIALVLVDPGTRNYVAKNDHIRIICMMLWLVLLLSFVFLFCDFYLFSHFRRNVKRLNQAAHADIIAGIPNRFSCDSLIEKYIGSPLPADIGCVMIDLSNIIEINQLHGREAGDAAIRHFSDTLHLVAAGQCFVGRNGGNKFIALFENCTQEQLNHFIERLNQQMKLANNHSHTLPIQYKYGIAFHGSDPSEADLGITDLISKANSRIYKKAEAL